MRTAILASQNRNKIREIRAILEKYGLDVVSRDDAGIPTDDIEETGVTFEANSYLKARTIFDMIREDPGLSQYPKPRYKSRQIRVRPPVHGSREQSGHDHSLRRAQNV